MEILKYLAGLFCWSLVGASLLNAYTTINGHWLLKDDWRCEKWDTQFQCTAYQKKNATICAEVPQ